MGHNLDGHQPWMTVVETGAFMSAAKACMTEAERQEAIAMITDNPECGDLIPGGGGIHKVRFAIGGQGKSGGVRIIYYYHDQSVPLFLLTVFAKNESSNLAMAELNQLAVAAKLLARKYGE